MYKKFILHLLLLTAVSNSQSLHASDEPINQLITYVIANISENSWYIWTKITQNSDQICSELSKQAEANKDEINKGVIGLTSAALLKTGTVAYDWMFPKKEDIAKQAEAEVRTEEANKRLKYLKAEANFSKCLESIKKDAQQNAEGIPTVCEEQARALILCDGEAALMVMLKNFNK
ncbi:hypothetical protein [Candidatus Chromulinivorax destructor]|uniref:Uncharacterized protein n=1 Tax=Candidatus Chromulinivorax destructor TaxID=2066483 RepID=A0A345ZCL9_9BACT|nr:hypothetical protein [Candidatus Chromulinivorax destructor]AXK61036.1 hypothetical protein C0J27_04875 [Candidatus Chromulinivorax destructor]